MSRIIAVASYLPENLLTNHELESRFPSWKAEKILAKTGIRKRHIANHLEGSEDMALAAAETHRGEGLRST